MLKLIFKLEEHTDLGFNVYAMHVSTARGINEKGGYLTLKEEEFETLKFALLEGTKSYQDGELQVEFVGTSSTPAFTQGA